MTSRLAPFVVIASVLWAGCADEPDAADPVERGRAEPEASDPPAPVEPVAEPEAPDGPAPVEPVAEPEVAEAPAPDEPPTKAKAARRPAGLLDDPALSKLAEEDVHWGPASPLEGATPIGAAAEDPP